jgi:predicted DNA-binding transcriptional regulator AlpA
MNAECKAAYSFQEFCRLHSISRALLYKLIKAGRGPKILKIGTRSLITAEAAAEWRREMESAA